MTTIIARCRFCGTKVKTFGGLCEPCTPPELTFVPGVGTVLLADDDLLTRLNRECDDIITERLVES